MAERPRCIVELPGGAEMGFREVSPGEFRMGSRFGWDAEEPVHRVRIGQAFWMAETPVTQAQWRAVVNALRSTSLAASPSEFKDDGDLRPVENVSWDDAVAWCTAAKSLKLTARGPGGLRVDRIEFRLPNEAEWEYACRGGTDTEYAAGDGDAALREIGWFDGNAEQKTHPVGELAPNGYGLFDLHGNVWEWCADVWDSKAYGKRADGWESRSWELADAGADAQFLNDAERSRGAALRVVRGGSWIHSAWDCRSSNRLWYWPGHRYWIQGFRVCLVRGPS